MELKTSGEIRATAWKTLCEGRWVTKYLLVAMALMVVFGIFQYGWNQAVEAMGIQTWSMFFDAKLKAMQSGLDLAVPSRAIALRMTEASAFEMFISCIVNGIFCFAAAGLLLRAAKGEGEGWFAKAFGGFKFPLGVAWLYFRLFFQILLWSLLFVIPGVMAYYRYCQCWNLKVENPDWPAGKCLAESARLMDGHKARRFALDLSYWKPIALLLMGVIAWPILVTVGAELVGRGAFGRIIGFALLSACIWGGIVLTVYMVIGHALFYLDLKNRVKN